MSRQEEFKKAEPELAEAIAVNFVEAEWFAASLEQLYQFFIYILIGHLCLYLSWSKD